MSFTSPVQMTFPPWTPAPGPISTIKSAARIVSSSCSTTITVFPLSRSRLRVAISLSLSRWCSPILGSSKIYKTPTNEEPIWVANRIRWLSPPDKVPEERNNVKYSKPTLCRNPSRSVISFKIRSAIMESRSDSFRFRINSSAFVTDILQKSIILIPPTVTERDIFFNRSP